MIFSSIVFLSAKGLRDASWGDNGELLMSKIQLKITPSLASVLNAEPSGWVSIEKELTKGVTMKDILAEIAPNFENFRNLVFDPATSEVNEEVTFFLNDKLLRFPGVLETVLQDGDSVMLALIFSGG